MAYIKRCQYIDCPYKYKPGSFFSFFKFPSDDRKELWVLHCGGEKFKEKMRVMKNIYICENHFRKEDIVEYSTKKTLSKNAIPLPFDNSFCTCSQTNIDIMCRPTINISSGCRPYIKKQKISHTSENFVTTVIHNPYELSPPSPPLVVKKEQNVRTYIRSYKIPLVPERMTPSPSQFPERDFDRCEEQRNSPVEEQRVFIPYDRENKESEKSNKSKEINEEVKKLLDGKGSEAKTFILSQLYHKHQNWSEDQKKLFQKIYFKSPACFKEMKNMGFTMPHPRTIMRWHGDIIFPVGLDGSIITLLREKCNEMTSLKRKCVLLFDEMSCKTELEYSSKEDKIYGFKDLGKDEKYSEIAHSVLLLMIRGINYNWKQSIAYFIGKVSVDELTNILKNVLEVLLDIGYDVMAVTGDQAPSNQSAYKKLGCKKNQPYTYIKNKRIMLLFDVPHLIKSIRNNLYKADIRVEENIMSWNVLRKIYMQEKNNTLKACFNLTEKHIDPTDFEKMSVKLATQVFSLNVSTGIELAVALNIFTPEEVAKASYTAESFRKINNLFDNLNSVVRFGANPQRRAISQDEQGKEVIQNLKEHKEWIEKWVHLGRFKRPPSFDGMVHTINGILLLWDDLKCTQQYLITSHLNQDPLENSISILRRNRGSYEKNPSPYRISKNIKQIAFQNYIPSSHTGYEISEAETLFGEPSDHVVFAEENDEEEEHMDKEFLNIFFADSTSEVQAELGEEEQGKNDGENEEDENRELLEDSNVHSISQLLEKNAITYFAGYVGKRISQKYKCQECTLFAISHGQEIKDDILIKLRAYHTKKTDSQYGNLTVPSSEFVKYVEAIISHFEIHISSLAYKNNVAKNLKQSFPCSSKNKFCETHEEEVFNFILVILIRFYTRKINRILFSSRKKKREKLRILQGL